MRGRAALEGGAVGAVAPDTVDQVARREGLGRQRRRVGRRDEGEVLHGHLYLPGNSGLRLARKAATPSARSSLAAIMPLPRASIRADAVLADAGLDHVLRDLDRARRQGRRPLRDRSRALASHVVGDLGHKAERERPAPPRSAGRRAPSPSPPAPAAAAPAAACRTSPARCRRRPPAAPASPSAPSPGCRRPRPARARRRRHGRRSPRPSACKPRQPVEDAVPLAHPVAREVDRAPVGPGGDVGAGAEGAVSLGGDDHRPHRRAPLSSVAQCASSASSIGTVSAFSLLGLSSRKLGDRRPRC